MERSIIGSILTDPSLFFSVNLRADEFSHPTFRDMFAAMADVAFNTNNDIDPLTVSVHMKSGVDSQRVSQCIKYAVDAKRTDQYIQMVRDAAIDRELRRRMSLAMASGLTGENLLNEIQKQLLQITNEVTSGAKHIGDYSTQMMDEITRRRNGVPSGVYDVSTGIPPVDEYMAVKRGGVVCIAGRPSMGKSAFTLWLSQRFLEQGERILLFSTESSAIQSTQRLYSDMTNISTRRIGTKVLSDQEFESAQIADARCQESALWINDQDVDLVTILREICKHKALNQISMVIIDHLQEVRVRGHRRSERSEINTILAELRNVSRKDPKISLVFVSQLNRGVENREKKLPLISDLRESGRIEEVADLIMLLYRPVYYDHDHDPEELLIAMAKNRDGPTGGVHGIWNHKLGLVEGIKDQYDSTWSVRDGLLLKNGVPKTRQTNL